MAVIALDLGGAKLAGGLFSSSGKIVCKRVVRLERRQGLAVGALVRAFYWTARFCAGSTRQPAPTAGWPWTARSGANLTPVAASSTTPSGKACRKWPASSSPSRRQKLHHSSDPILLPLPTFLPL